MQAGYLSELRDSWRPLLAAMIGLGSGMSMAGVITSTLAPSMVRDNRWDPAEFALVGSLALVTAFAFPFIGRLGDVLGVKRTALIGQIVMPVSMLAYSLMSGELWVYMAIFFVQSILAVTTTATVYSRLAVQYVTKARGLALAIVAAGPALSGIVMAPILNAYVEEFGWRASYQALAVFTAVAGLATFFLIPPEQSHGGASAPKRRAREDYPLIFRTPAFWILLGAMLLCNLPATVILVQLKLLVTANGVSGDDAAVMLTTVRSACLPAVSSPASRSIGCARTLSRSYRSPCPAWACSSSPRATTALRC